MVDRDPLVRQIIELWLTPPEYLVLPAGDGASALQILTNVNVDLLITDELLSDMGGSDLARRVMEQYSTAVLLLSDHPQADLDPKLPETMFFLQKPLSVGQVTDMVKRILYALTPVGGVAIIPPIPATLLKAEPER